MNVYSRLITLALCFFVITDKAFGQRTHEIKVNITQGQECPILSVTDGDELFGVYYDHHGNLLTIRSKGLTVTAPKLYLIDLFGRVVKERQITGETTRISTSQLRHGIYVLRIISKESFDVTKISIR